MTTPKKLTLPTIHMNGTGADMLIEGYSNAHHALQEADEAIRRIEFNARDYYVDGPEAWDRAHDEMRDRRIKLRDIMDELQAIMIHIDRSRRD